MCGRFSLTVPSDEQLAATLGIPLESLRRHQPRYNIAPMQEHIVITMEYEERQAERARWGLVPVWARNKGEKERNQMAGRMINARAEGIEGKPSFRAAFKQRRCVVPADGFYEWRGPKNDREPMFIRRPDGGLLLFAGLYEPAPWADEDGAQYTFTIITTEANGMMEELHNRMPVILDGDEVDAWIDPNNPEPKSLLPLLDPAPEDLLFMSPASKRLNSPRNEGDPTLLEPDGKLL